MSLENPIGVNFEIWYWKNERVVGQETLFVVTELPNNEWVDDEQAEANALVYAEAVVENGRYGEWDWETDRIETERL